MSSWTLALDESGRFEGGAIAGEKAERRGYVVGGVLFPRAASEVERAWRDDFGKLCWTIGGRYPPHANELSLDQTELLRARATTELKAVDGIWLFLVDEPDADRSPDSAWTRYVRMLGEVVDLAARTVALRGGHRLDVLPAQRSVPLDPSQEGSAATAGEAIEGPDGPRLRTLSAVEVRLTLEALRREDIGWSLPYPATGAIDVVSAGSRAVHPAVAFADLGCNHVWRSMSSPDAMAELVDELGGAERLWLVARSEARRLRELDRAVRDTPPDLVRAARHVAALAARDPSAGQSGIAARLWTDATGALLKRVEKDRHWPALGRALAGQAEAVLSIKGGAYEGLWLALRDAWLGATQLAEGTRGAAPLELQAQLWRLTMECANHRGDTATAIDAARAAEAVFARARSFRLLAERQQVSNLAVVRLQNELPAHETDLDRIRAELLRYADHLVETAEEAGALLGIGFDESAEAAPVLPDESEQRLWLAADREPSFAPPDIERGRLYGTAARSHAFLGQLDRAFDLAMQARSFFWGSSFDLSFNASVIARIELERARRGELRRERLSAALELAGVSRVRKLSRVIEALQRGDHGARFAFDVLLRTLLWAPAATDVSIDTWVPALVSDELLAMLSTEELRSHPTELIARHAGELLLAQGKEHAARRWLDLSIELCEQAPAGTLWRLGHFSRLVRDGEPSMGQGPPGSLVNPTFEYR